jgi:hypothetical protein
MITMLFAALCVAYGPGEECVDRQIFPAGRWEGPTAPIECEAEAMASRERLTKEGLAYHFTIYCESTPEGE